MRKKLFILSFICSLITPTLLFVVFKNHLDTTNYENRTLAEFPDVSIYNIFNFPSEFETYYTDHVPFKNYFVNIKNRIDTRLFGIKNIDSVTIGKDNWLFYTVSVDGEDALADYQHTNLYTSEEKEQIGDKIQNVSQAFLNQGIRFHIFCVPNKETIYKAYMPDEIPVYEEFSRLDTIMSYLSEKRHLPVYNLTDLLKSHKDDYQLFYKYDTHWNQMGSYFACMKIAEIFLGNPPAPDPLQLEPRTGRSGDLASLLGMATEFNDDTEYVIMNYLPNVEVECLETNETNTYQIFNSNSPNPKTLLVVGDSFTHATKDFLNKLYQTSVFVTFNTYTPELFSKYQFDDVVFLTVERNQKFFEQMDEVLAGKNLSKE